VGGAGADSLQGVYNDMQKLGLGVQDLDKFVALVAGSSKELAMMSGSVIKGRKEYAEMSKGMERFKGSLMNSGMTQDEINEGSIGYLRIQSRIGMTQKKSADELAASTAKYLEQQDALTQLTGLTRKEQEATREEIRSQEAFGAKLLQLRNAGQEDAAKELEDTYILLASKSKSAAQGFGDIATGNLRTEAAQKSMRATQGESMRTAQALAAGQLKAAEGADSIAQAHARTLDTFGETQGQLGNYNKTFSDFGGDMALKAGQTSGGFAKAAAELRIERDKQGTNGKKALSAEQQRQVDLAITQQKSMQNMQDFVRYGVEPATKATAWFAETVETLTSLLPGAGEAKEKLEIERKTKKLEEAQIELVAAQEKRNKALSEAEKTAADESIKAAETKLENSKKERLMYIKNSENFKLTNKEAQELNAKIGNAGKPAEMATTGGGAATGNPNIARQGKRGGATQDTPAPAAPAATPAAAPAPPPAQMGGKFNRMPGASTAPGVPAPAASTAPAAAAPAAAAPAAAPAAAAPAAAPTPPNSGGGAIPVDVANSKFKKYADATGTGALAKNIAAYESGRAGYNAYNRGTIGNKMIGSDKPIDFSKMSIDEYLRHGKLKSGDPDKIFAVGKYQIIPKTMEGLVSKLKLEPEKTLLDQTTQDILFNEGLINQSRPNVAAYLAGKSNDRDLAILDMAKEFASVGVPYPAGKATARGQSYYAGIGGNKAHNPPEAVGAALDADRKNAVTAADGGMFSGPKSGYSATLHGDEAVIPLNKGAVPVAMPKNFMEGISKYQSFMDQIKEGIAKTNNSTGYKEEAEKIKSQGSAGSNTDAMVTAFKQLSDDLKAQAETNRELFESMLRAQNNSNDIQSKMLRVAQS
jgi:hypothetical protein